jgi:hypothetical protein
MVKIIREESAQGSTVAQALYDQLDYVTQVEEVNYHYLLHNLVSCLLEDGIGEDSMVALLDLLCVTDLDLYQEVGGLDPVNYYRKAK